MVDFGVQNFQQANVGFWNTQKVIWKTLGSYNLTEESGTGSLTGKVQVELSNLGQDNASFSGNWLSC